jgi:hypothetical protein
MCVETRFHTAAAHDVCVAVAASRVTIILIRMVPWADAHGYLRRRFAAEIGFVSVIYRLMPQLRALVA